MARIRTIKPEFQNSQSMGRVSRDARLTFIELWPQCDDAGRIRANSRMLASVLFPYDADAPNLIDGWLSELETEGCIIRYRVEKDEYLQIIHWDHQKIDHPQPSKLPAHPGKKAKKTKLIVREETKNDREPSSVVRAVSSTVSEGIITNKLPADAGTVRVDSDFEEFRTAYKPPPNSKKPDDLKAWNQTAKTRPPQEDLLRAVAAYNTWLADKSREQRREYPKQLPATWLRGEVWSGYLDHSGPVDLTKLRASRENLASMGYPTAKLDRAIEEAEARAA